MLSFDKLKLTLCGAPEVKNPFCYCSKIICNCKWWL